jgi:hypothetical protein
MVIGDKGINFVDLGQVEGVDPLAPFGPNAAKHIIRESSFLDCPDVIVNTKFDPQTEELCGFENQVSHHGGLGGPQNRPFVLYPAVLPYDGKPVIWATGVYHLLRGWRDAAQSGQAGNAVEPAHNGGTQTPAPAPSSQPSGG